jgi:hypothetical protein
MFAVKVHFGKTSVICPSLEQLDILQFGQMMFLCSKVCYCNSFKFACQVFLLISDTSCCVLLSDTYRFSF